MGDLYDQVKEEERIATGRIAALRKMLVDANDQWDMRGGDAHNISLRNRSGLKSDSNPDGTLAADGRGRGFDAAMDIFENSFSKDILTLPASVTVPPRLYLHLCADVRSLAAHLKAEATTTTFDKFVSNIEHDAYKKAISETVADVQKILDWIGKNS